MKRRRAVAPVLGCALVVALASGCSSSHRGNSSSATTSVPASAAGAGGTQGPPTTVPTGAAAQQADLGAITRDLQDVGAATNQEGADLGAAAAAQAQNDGG